MLITTMFVWFCSSALMDDCQVYAHSQWSGRRGLEQCENLKETVTASLNEPLPYMRLSCEQEWQEGTDDGSKVL